MAVLDESFSECGIVGCRMLVGNSKLEGRPSEGRPTVKASLVEDEDDDVGELGLALELEAAISEASVVFVEVEADLELMVA